MWLGQKVRRHPAEKQSVASNQLAASLVDNRLYFMGGNYSTVSYDGQLIQPSKFSETHTLQC
jgi:hypothetical protein